MQYGRVFPVAMAGELQIAMFCTPQRMDAEIRAAAHSGGSRAMAAAGDRHTARLAFQSVSVLIADSVQVASALDLDHASRRTGCYVGVSAVLPFRHLAGSGPPYWCPVGTVRS
jgi:ribonuclease PH